MRFRIILLLGCCLLLTACPDPTPPTPTTPKVTSVKLKVTATSLTVGQTMQIGWETTGYGDYDKRLTWQSSNPGVAKVSSSQGEVEGVSAGQVTITASSITNPEVKDSVSLTIVSNVPNKPAALPSGGMLAARVSGPVSPRELSFEVDVFVVDKDSKPVTSLSPSAFDIAAATFPNGTFFSFDQTCATPRQTPAQGNYSAVLLLDQSGSILSTDPGDSRIDAASIFFKALGAGDNALLAAFAANGARSEWFKYWGNFGKATYDAELAALAKSEDGGTPLYEATSIFIREAANKALNANKAVVVFTDGEDTAGGFTIPQVVSQATASGVKVFTVGLGSANTRVLSQMSVPTGGAMMFAGDARQLISMFGTLGNLLSGNLAYYQTCWRVTTDQDAFGIGAWFSTSIKITSGNGDFYIPFSLEIP
jgi:von Willebrand factor type A domain/Bacterial Ig-like domain (group 2)